MKLYRTRYGITTLLVVIAVAALLMWAWRYYRDSQPPGIWIRWLEDSDVSRQDMALMELARMGPKAKVAAGPLMRIMMSVEKTPHIRANAIYTLSYVLKVDPKGPEGMAAESALIEAIKDPDAQVRRMAAGTLGTLGSDDRAALTALRPALRDPDPWVRGTAVSGLAEVAARDHKPHPELYDDIRQTMRTDNEHVRQMSIYALLLLQRNSPGLIRQLMRDEDARIRRCVVELMWRFTPQASELVADLAACVSDPDVGVRNGAIRALGLYANGSAASAIPSLIGALADPDEDVRSNAADVLALQQARAEDAVAPLEALTRDRSPRVQSSATHALERIKAGLEAVRKDLETQIPRLHAKAVQDRCVAASHIGEYGRQARTAVPALIELLADRETQVRRATAEALGQIGESTDTVLQALDRTANEDRAREVRQSAAGGATLLRRIRSPSDSATRSRSDAPPRR
jgi:HEAT repeat protein